MKFVILSFFVGIVIFLSSCSSNSGSSKSDKNVETPDNRVVLQKAEPITVKVAVVYQNPKIPTMENKRFHEIFKTPGYDFKWNNPEELNRLYKDSMESVSGGVVKYEIVKVYDESKLFTRFKDSDKLLAAEEVTDLLLEEDWQTLKDRNTTFDYKAFIEHYGFDKMRDNDEIHEVWVWSFPYGGMWESTLAGENAYWLNSNPVEGVTNKKLLTVMGFNYERTFDLAMHSFGHRAESVMRHVYGRWEANHENPNKWELFATLDKDTKDRAGVGNIHFPPNGAKDYDYKNTTLVKTYADVWKYYPDITYENPRIVKCDEWGCNHLGYMTWWFKHVPNFKGLDSKDRHLNNWWHYMVNYNEAIELEQKSFVQ